MDVFEDQLNIALDCIPEMEPGSPAPIETTLSPPQSPAAVRGGTVRSRPSTRDTQMSSLSRASVIKPASMIGSARQPVMQQSASVSVRSRNGLDRRAFERSEYVSSRIASIQTKVSAFSARPRLS